MVSLDRCNESCITVEDLLSRTYVPNKVEGANLNFFDVVKIINE